VCCSVEYSLGPNLRWHKTTWADTLNWIQSIWPTH
jgi:hypothetical protein